METTVSRINDVSRDLARSSTHEKGLALARAGCQTRELVRSPHLSLHVPTVPCTAVSHAVGLGLWTTGIVSL